MIPLRRTISVATCSVAVAAAFGVSFLFNEHAKDISLRSTLKALRGEVEVLAHYFSERHDQISADAALAARGRGIHSILENKDQPTIGTPSESERDLLVDYIADVFLALLETRPEYTQVRLIGLKNGGKEIIRVNKNADGEVVRTPEIALQDKSGEPYFQEFVNHFQTGGDMFEESMSQVIYSRVTFNRENGRISYPLSFTLRAMHPVFDETRVPVGFVIINVDYNKLLSTAFSDISPDSRVIILNDQGDYLNYAGEAAVTSLEVAGEYTHSPSPPGSDALGEQ